MNAVSIVPRPKRLAAEFIGTTFLLMTVVGSGIMGETLADGNTALALLANALATGAMLFVLILIFAPASGAHFNPAVTLAFAVRREISLPDGAAFVAAQLTGAVAGVWLAHAMFADDILQLSTNPRTGASQWLAEAVATFGLVAAILGALRWGTIAVAAAVGLYISAAYWFTASTSFANPAVTVARMLTDTFSGIRAIDAPAFIVAQFFGAIAAVSLAGWLFREE